MSLYLERIYQLVYWGWSPNPKIPNLHSPMVKAGGRPMRNGHNALSYLATHWTLTDAMNRACLDLIFETTKPERDFVDHTLASLAAIPDIPLNRPLQVLAIWEEAEERDWYAVTELVMKARRELYGDNVQVINAPVAAPVTPPANRFKRSRGRPWPNQQLPVQFDRVESAKNKKVRVIRDEHTIDLAELNRIRATKVPKHLAVPAPGL